ncbi:ligand-binding sensor domain-containing diguanylate cyclase [Oceanisphaera pacifica]|uniref:diguanylate cyclase n=1 Tax=Oceanisphaera pacifica TaxID=2818389 RepID=A0ABS3NGS7_9GAMM|nr:ligand-binding sensor domain-containing diguanylate cyclase [Oceanisphaera pacifica]MBO1519772.1 diguanylate cyclase [Oceanisphaera pacifica]
MNTYFCLQRGKVISAILCVLSLFLSSSLLAASVPLTDYYQDHWNTRDGLPHNSINDIAQTAQGYLWFATWEGVVRYNGRQFRVFTRGDESGLPDSGIRGLTRDDQGLWVVGARGGISHYQHQAWSPQPDADAMVNHALPTRDGRLWLATQNDGIYVRDGKKTVAHFSIEQGLPSPDVYHLIEDKAGRVWAGTAKGLVSITNNKVHLINDIPLVATEALFIDDRNRLLIGSEQGLFAMEEGKVRSLYGEQIQQAVISILQDKSGDLWLGTADRGLVRISQFGIERLEVKHGLPEQRVMSLFEDTEGSMWVGTNGGLMRLREVPFTSVTEQDGLAGNYVRTVLAHSDGSVWVGSSTGLTQIKNGHVQPLELTMPDGTVPSILSLAQGGPNELWVGTFTHGLLQIKHGKLVARYQRAQGLPSNEVRAILPTQAGSIWIGTANGLSQLNNNTLVNYSTQDGLPGNFIMNLHLGVKGDIWVGTGVGAAIIHQQKITPVYLNSQENAEYAFGFYAEPNGKYMWLATDRGLVRYRYADKSLAVVGLKHGLSIEKVFQPVADQLGNLWLTTNRGIMRIRLADAHNVADGKQALIEFEHFDESDGMASSQANGGSGPSAVATADGKIWIATALGVAQVQPKRLAAFANQNLPVVLETVSVAGKPLSLASNMVLEPGSGRLQLHYAGLGFVIPERIKYRTLLEGFDQEWVMRDHQGVAEYTNLPPGQYRFRVAAAYPYDDWSQQEASVSVKVLPFIWQLPLFWGVIVTLVLVVFWLVLRWRIQFFEYHNQELSRQVADKTSKLQQQAQDFELQAREDQLTGLPNRRAFDEALAMIMARLARQSAPLSMMVIDIDHFKQVNDTLSHAVGDKVIQVVAGVIQEQIRNVDHPARWGGEEFTVLLPDTDTDTAYQVAERVRLAVAAHDYSEIAPQLRLTISIGIAQIANNVDEHQLLIQADKALYQAKRQGRNQVVVYSAANDKA